MKIKYKRRHYFEELSQWAARIDQNYRASTHAKPTRPIDEATERLKAAALKRMRKQVKRVEHDRKENLK